MRLFHRKPKETWTKSSCVVKCPNCGKEHVLAVYDFKVRLDGMPALPSSAFSKILTVCDCGMLVSKMDLNPNVMQLDGYKAAMQEPDETLRLLKLLYYADAQDETVWLHIANYYRDKEMPTQERGALLKFIAALNNGAQAWQEVYAGEFASLRIIESICLEPEHYLIDAYRRIGNWDAALQLIQQEKKRKYYADPSDIMRWLHKEETLIRARDTSPQ